MTTQNEFLKALQGIQQQAQRIRIPDIAVLRSFIRVSESQVSVDDPPEIEERALVAQDYLAFPPNQLINPDFTGGLGSWTESIESGIVATTAAESGKANTFALHASMESLKLDLTDGDTNSNVVERRQNIAADPSDIWDVEAYAFVNALSGARAVLRIDFLDVGLSSLQNASVVISAINSDFVQMKLENQVAPASTVWIQVRLQIEVTGAPNATGIVYFDKTNAELGETTISVRARRIITGEWVCQS